MEFSRMQDGYLFDSSKSSRISFEDRDRGGPDRVISHLYRGGPTGYFIYQEWPMKTGQYHIETLTIGQALDIYLGHPVQDVTMEKAFPVLGARFDNTIGTHVHPSISQRETTVEYRNEVFMRFLAFRRECDAYGGIPKGAIPYIRSVGLHAGLDEYDCDLLLTYRDE